MAAVNGKAATPSLSNLQAALRKAPAVAKTAAPKPAQPAQPGAPRPALLPAQGLKRPAEQAPAGAPALKKIITISKAPAPVAARPGIAKAPVAGVPKPAATLAPRPAGGNLAPQSKSGNVVVVAGSQASTEGAAQDPLSLAAAIQLVGAIEDAPVGPKMRSLVRLADAVGENLQIEHINHFLRALKKKVVERAQRDGVRMPVAKSPAPVAAAAKSTPERVLSQPVAGSAAKSAPGALAPKSAAPGGTPLVRPAMTKSPAPVAAKTPAPAKPQPPKAPQPRPAAPASPPAPEANDEALFELMSDLGENPVCADGVLNEARLGEVLKSLWDGIARKNKDWIVAWQAMAITHDKQTQVLQKFLNMTFMEADAQRAPQVVAELVKAHKVKLRSVEEVLVAFGSNIDGVLAMNEEAWHVYSQFLMQVFPKPANAGWGWSRIGWSWQSWWKFMEQCTQSLEGSRSADVLILILKLVQEKEGLPIMEQQIWTEADKLQKVVARVATLCNCEVEDAVEKMAACGVAITV